MAGKKYYVALAPDGTRERFATWEECRTFRDSNPGTLVQSVDSPEKADQMVAGGILLDPGRFAFTDGNALGGVGIILLESDGSDVRDVEEISTNVFDVFEPALIPGLETRDEIAGALNSHHNILAELAGLFGALAGVTAHSSLTVVHDYAGVGAWMTDGGWKTRSPVTSAVVTACKNLVTDRGLTVAYQHQRGHQSNWAGRDDYALWNAKADELATRGALDLPGA